MTPRVLASLAATALILAAVACSATPSADSSLPNFTDTTAVWTVNGAPAGAPTALDLFSGAAIRADQAFAYDLAIDIDSVGNVILYPVSRLATTLSAVRRVGMQLMAPPYESLLSAPRGGYAYDSTFRVAAGTIVAIESDDTADCGTSITGAEFYAKLEIVSIDLVARIVHTIYTVDRNCGFHSLVPNLVPTS